MTSIHLQTRKSTQPRGLAAGVGLGAWEGSPAGLQVELLGSHCATSTVQPPQMPNKEAAGCATDCRMNLLPELSLLLQRDATSAACWLQTLPVQSPYMLARRPHLSHLHEDNQPISSFNSTRTGKFQQGKLSVCWSHLQPTKKA